MPAAVYNKVMMLPKPSVAERANARQNIVLALLLLFVIGAWGGNYVITKIAVRTNGPWAFNAFRYTTAATLLATGLCYQQGWRSLIPARGGAEAGARGGYSDYRIALAYDRPGLAARPLQSREPLSGG